MYKGFQRRAHKRLSTSCQFRINTSLSRISYGADVSDISRAGAYVISKHAPPVGEVINIEVLDSYGKKLFDCSSLVKNVRKIFSEFGSESGFGVQFIEDLTPDQLERLTEE